MGVRGNSGEEGDGEGLIRINHKLEIIKLLLSQLKKAPKSDFIFFIIIRNGSWSCTGSFGRLTL